ncbi:uncharacterized protein LOC131212615 [Anopheles bellator]|nr:uncharacterized protein LOC131212615 [Anopheles bellator]
MKLSFDVRLCVRPSSVFSTIVEMVQWVTLIVNLTCALHLRYAECKFVD